MAAQMTPEQQAIVTLQTELQQTRVQIANLSNAHDALKVAHDNLNLAAASAIAIPALGAKRVQKIRGVWFFFPDTIS